MNLSTIKSRVSTRTYAGSFSKDQKEQIEMFRKNPENFKSPLKSSIRIEWVETVPGTPQPVGTYGMIRNASAFMALICPSNDAGLLDGGFVFEKFILFLESIGLGSCWLGGTFNRNQLNFSKPLQEKEIVPIVTPIGLPSTKKSLLEKGISKFFNPRKRKEFNSLFKTAENHSPIAYSHIRTALEMVRLAPSALNKQPWRVLIDKENTAHFYTAQPPRISKSHGYDIQKIDMGIAICHYSLASGYTHFVKCLPNFTPPESWHYVLSVLPETL